MKDQQRNILSIYEVCRMLIQLTAANCLTTKSLELDTRSLSKPQKDDFQEKHWAQKNLSKFGMEWTISSIRQRTASNRIPVIWTITLKHLRQISLEMKMKPLTNQKYYSWWTGFPDSNAFTINYTTYDEMQIILNLRNNCSSSHNNISVQFLKLVVDQMTSPFVHITKTSIGKEIFPDSWKVTRMCLIQN